MKKLLLVIFAAASAAWSSAQTTFVSNLESPFSGGGIYSLDNRWIARSFTTGTHETGYVLDWVDFSFHADGGTDPAFFASIWTTDGTTPAAELIGLAALGAEQFAPAAATALNPNTTYWLVIGTTSPFSTANYAWNFADDSTAAALDGWTMGTSYLSDTSGATWQLYGAAFQFSVTATAVAIPEPATWTAMMGFFVFGTAFIAAARRRNLARRAAIE